MAIKDFNISMPISKVDEEQRMIWGYATTDAIDKQGEIVDYEASKKAFKAWPGNIREQHDPKKAIGKRVEVNFDDTNKGVWVGAKISRSADGENAWTKIKEGVLAGFSIGGRVKKMEGVTTKDAEGNDAETMVIKDYDLTELSVVDNPANPMSMLQMVKSMDGELYGAEVLQRFNDPLSRDWWSKYYQFSTEQIEKVSSVSNNKENDMSDLEKVDSETVDTEKVDYNVRPQSGSAAQANGTEPGRGVTVAEDKELNDADRASLPGGASASNNTKPLTVRDEQGNIYSLTLQNGAQATEDATEPGRGTNIEEDVEEDTEADDPDGDANQKKNPVAKPLSVNTAGQRLSSSFEPTDLAKAIVAEMAKAAVKPAESQNIATKSDDVTKGGEVSTLTALVKDLTDRITRMESQPATATPKRYIDVDKVDGDDDESTPESEYAALVKQSQEWAKNTETVTPSQRSELAFKLRKAARRLQQ